MQNKEQIAYGKEICLKGQTKKIYAMMTVEQNHAEYQYFIKIFRGDLRL